MTATAEAIDNLRRLSDSIKKKILEQELHNKVATEKMKSRYSLTHSSAGTNATTRVASTRHSAMGGYHHGRSDSFGG